MIVAGMYCIGQRKFVSLQQLVDHYQVDFETQYFFIIQLLPCDLMDPKKCFFLPESSDLHLTKGGKAISDQTFGQVSGAKCPPVIVLTSKLLKVKISTKQTPPQSEKLNFNFCCKLCPSKSGIQWRKLCKFCIFSFYKKYYLVLNTKILTIGIST